MFQLRSPSLLLRPSHVISFIVGAAVAATVAHSAAGEPGQETSTHLANQALMALQKCNLTDGDGVDLSTAEDKIDIIVGDVGRVVLLRDHEGDVRGSVTLAVGGDPIEALIHLISEGKPGPFCDQIYKATKVRSADLVDLIDEARSLEISLSLEEVLRLHRDLVTVEMSFSNLAIKAQWFGCDASNLATWVQSVLRRVAPELDPCGGTRRLTSSKAESAHE